MNQSELAAFQSQVGVSNGVDQSQDSAQTSLCEEEEGTDETRLLGGEESDDSESRTSNLFISNPTATDADPLSADLAIEEEMSIDVMRKNVAEERQRELQEGVEEVVNQEKEGKEQDREVKELLGEEEHKEKKALHRNRYLSTILSTLKNSLLDIRLFLW